MGIFRRTPAARVAVTPEVVRRRQTVTATISTDRAIDKVSSATLEWGYTNYYRYRWAGRADSMAAEMNDVWWLMGEVGTDAGSEKDTDDWVCVTREEIPLADGRFTGVTSSFTVPSWAPGSSDDLARWSARLAVDRGGRDVEGHGEFTVVLGRDDGEVADESQRRTAGDGETDLAIVLPSTVFVAGETINGSVTLAPNVDMSDGEIGISWGYTRLSHPLTRTPAAGGGGKIGPTVKLGKGIPLHKGVPVTVPFALPLPEDAPPAGEAVHSSIVWFLEATLTYSKWAQGIEKMRRQIAVVSAP